MIEIIKEKLKVFDDKNFSFDPIPHKYYHGDTELISVTTFLKNFCKEFDSDYWSRRKAKEFGMTQEQVLAMWQAKTDIACEHGNTVHNYIEDYFMGNNPKIPDSPDARHCCEKFVDYCKSKMMELQPVVMEQRVFDLEWGISGTIDSLFIGRGKLWLGDWKTNGKFRHDSDYNYNQMLLKPFGDLKDNEFNKYSIQVSLYRILLEKQGIDTEAAFICHIPREGDIKVYKALDLRERLRNYFTFKQYNKMIPDNDELLELF